MTKSLSLPDQLNMKSEAKVKFVGVRRHVELAMAVLSPWGGSVPSAINHTREAEKELTAAKRILNTLWRKTSYVKVKERAK